MKGYRKVAMVAIVGTVIALCPNMSDQQIQLLQILIGAAFGGNAVEHVVEGVQNGVRIRGAGGAIRAVRSVSVPASPANNH